MGPAQGDALRGGEGERLPRGQGHPPRWDDNPEHKHPSEPGVPGRPPPAPRQHPDWSRPRAGPPCSANICVKLSWEFFPPLGRPRSPLPLPRTGQV